MLNTMVPQPLGVYLNTINVYMFNIFMYACIHPCTYVYVSICMHVYVRMCIHRYVNIRISTGY